METPVISYVSEKEAIQKKFDELTELARKTYPGLDATISSFNTTMAENNEFFGFLLMKINQPSEISTNQFTIQ